MPIDSISRNTLNTQGPSTDTFIDEVNRPFQGNSPDIIRNQNMYHAASTAIGSEEKKLDPLSIIAARAYIVNGKPFVLNLHPEIKTLLIYAKNHSELATLLLDHGVDKSELVNYLLENELKPDRVSDMCEIKDDDMKKNVQRIYNFHLSIKLLNQGLSPEQVALELEIDINDNDDLSPWSILKQTAALNTQSVT